MGDFMIIELCAGSARDAMLAEKYGISRIELNTGLELGGLTPYISVVEHIKSNCNVKIIAMLRLRAGNFVYSHDELDIMLDMAENLLKAGADGLAFGAITLDKDVDIYACKSVLEKARKYNAEFVFHRAFDQLPSIHYIEKLIDFGADRLLTSGLYPSAWDGKDNIKAMQEQYGSEIEILAGSGINTANVLKIAEYTGVKQVHGSFSESIKENYNGSVSFGSYLRSSEQKLIELQKILKG